MYRTKRCVCLDNRFCEYIFPFTRGSKRVVLFDFSTLTPFLRGFESVAALEFRCSGIRFQHPKCPSSYCRFMPREFCIVLNVGIVSNPRGHVQIDDVCLLLQ